MNGMTSYSHCPICGQQLILGQFFCGHQPEGMTNPRPEVENRPQPGDRVKLCGNHRQAGHSGVYVCDRQFYAEGSSSPIVRLDVTREEVFVLDPDRQMKKAT